MLHIEAAQIISLIVLTAATRTKLEKMVAHPAPPFCLALCEWPHKNYQANGSHSGSKPPILLHIIHIILGLRRCANIKLVCKSGDAL
jgi:hypothetical protein